MPSMDSIQQAIYPILVWSIDHAGIIVGLGIVVLLVIATFATPMNGDPPGEEPKRKDRS